MKKIYTIDQVAKRLEIGTLLNENYLCSGATVETWLCKGSDGRNFVCSKNYYQFSELEAWQEYEADLKDGCESYLAEIAKMQEEYKELLEECLVVKQKIESLAEEKAINS